VLARLFHLRPREGIGLRDLPQSFRHLRELRRVQRLDGELDDGLVVEPRWLEDGAGVITGIVHYGCRFRDVLADAFQDDAVARARLQNFCDVAAVTHADPLHDTRSLVLGVLGTISFA